MSWHGLRRCACMWHDHTIPYHPISCISCHKFASKIRLLPECISEARDSRVKTLADRAVMREYIDGFGGRLLLRGSGKRGEGVMTRIGNVLMRSRFLLRFTANFVGHI